MTPCEIIAKVRVKMTGFATGSIGLPFADAAIEALTSAGYRILGPGELDPETLERCAEVVRPNGSRPCGCDRCDCGNAGELEMVTAWDQQAATATAIRALAKETGQ